MTQTNFNLLFDQDREYIIADKDPIGIILFPDFLTVFQNVFQ
jgi:hypothetical protein